MKRKNIITNVIMIAMLCAGMLMPAMASPSLPTNGREIAFSGCGCKADVELLRSIRDEIAAAENVQMARERALSTTQSARKALSKARLMAPWSEDLREAYRRLEAYEEKVMAASDSEEVAEEFETFVRLVSAGNTMMVANNDNDLELDEENNNNGCDYSTGDVIAIIVGFILGIIPGIILLFVLC
ncbi:MAG: hypothetical protein GF401_16160 [Chitinivibrionales bacterium]|nr:hypothetical protein [Chitinivibrionales bacterium]